MKTRFAFIVLALLSFFYGCKNQKNEIDSIYQYKEYVNYTTSGIVSVTENITVNLAKSIENWEPSYKISSNIIDVKPNISGKVKILNNCNLFNGINLNKGFYFIHSYYIDVDNDKNIMATSEYVKTFTSAIYSSNIFAVQFHPEKSHSNGMKFLKNFAEI